MKLVKFRRKSNRIWLTSLKFWFRVLVTVIVLAQALQLPVSSSRKFLTGLIIGTLLARNGMPQGPIYSGPPNQVHYSGGHQSSGHHQPLLIIIPQASSSRKSHKPHIIHQSSHDEQLDYSHIEYPSQLARRRLASIRSRYYPRPTSAPASAPSSLRMRKILGSLSTPMVGGAKAIHVDGASPLPPPEHRHHQRHRYHHQQHRRMEKAPTTATRSLAASDLIDAGAQLSLNTNRSGLGLRSRGSRPAPTNSLAESERYFVEERRR